MPVTQGKGEPHVGLVADAIELIARTMMRRLGEINFEVEQSFDDGSTVQVGFGLSEAEYSALESLGNKLRRNMSPLDEYRWDFIMTMLYEDLYIDDQGNDTGRVVVKKES